MKKPLDPKWLVLISLLFSFLVAGIVAGFNYGHLGRPEKKRKVILYTVLGFILLLVITAMLPPLDWLFYFGINLGIGMFLSGDQQIDYLRWKSKM